MPASCKSCSAPIEWAEWEASGKAVPLDVDPSPNGNLALVAGKVHRYTAQDATLGREKRISHFASCPDAPDWRKK